jgi:hypothetical protein
MLRSRPIAVATLYHDVLRFDVLITSAGQEIYLTKITGLPYLLIVNRIRLRIEPKVSRRLLLGRDWSAFGPAVGRGGPVTQKFCIDLRSNWIKFSKFSSVATGRDLL